MPELAEIFKEFGTAYIAKHGEKMLPSHRCAMRDIESCRTAVMGGEVYLCKKCNEYNYSYHSCKNRSCPKCGNKESQQWLESQKEQLLAVPYFLYTPTLPHEFNTLFFTNQKELLGIFFKTSASAIQKLALDPKYVGARIGLTGVLQTWKRDMGLHIHIHYIVPGGGITADSLEWKNSRYKDFLVAEKPLGIIFKGKFKAALKKAALFDKVPTSVWKKVWVVDCKHIGSGEHALKYLAPYIRRIALTNKRIESSENGEITFRYKPGDSKSWKQMTLTASKFIGRFLQHVLPRGFVKVRSYGFLSQGQRTNNLKKVQNLLQTDNKKDEKERTPDNENLICADKFSAVINCPHCGGGLIFIRTIPRSLSNWQPP